MKNDLEIIITLGTDNDGTCTGTIALGPDGLLPTDLRAIEWGESICSHADREADAVVSSGEADDLIAKAIAKANAAIRKGALAANNEVSLAWERRKSRHYSVSIDAYAL